MKVIAVTPAGRRRYLDVLAKHILSDEAVAEWHLWDNCRDPVDRAYIQSLASPKIKIVALPNSTGDNKSINKFYRTMTDPDAFYVKLDDDICYLPPGFFGRFAAKAAASKTNAIWFSPLVINNAICSWLLSFHGKIKSSDALSCQAACEIGWRNPQFAVLLHRAFLNRIETDRVESLHIPDATMTLGRFSINCLGVFGADRNALGDAFCPLDVDDEEHISAFLPMMTKRPGQIIGDEVVAHFAYYTQERVVLETDILERYHLEAVRRRPSSSLISSEAVLATA
ncbi:hypothetical protein IC762_07165 [Bradyrhizobium genosp. L]|uniref:hypothetical protein n=1 Tax=Bradyrhizobium genosp. L TaxID=83637 RepID=UPI0018A2FA59|nr:hypothetical protein [Bradyrhizobium genosp. L]QPF86073.1 hypothetical protein IC762_07165 [Bradyrhizobium genosp. L]